MNADTRRARAAADRARAAREWAYIRDMNIETAAAGADPIQAAAARRARAAIDAAAAAGADGWAAMGRMGAAIRAARAAGIDIHPIYRRGRGGRRRG